MARIKHSFFSISGTLGDLVFIDGPQRKYVRRKSSLNKTRVMNDEAFANSRKGMSQFRRDNSLRTLIKNQCIPFTNPGIDPSLLKRLSTRIKQIRDYDTQNDMGNKTVHNQKISLFNGFELNSNYPMHNIYATRPHVDYIDQPSSHKIRVSFILSPAEVWIPVSMDGFVIHIKLFSFDEHYTMVSTSRHTSSLYSDFTSKIEYEHVFQPASSPGCATLCVVGVQSVFGNLNDWEGTTASYGLRGQILVPFLIVGDEPFPRATEQLTSRCKRH